MDTSNQTDINQSAAPPINAKTENQPIFSFIRHYVKDLSLEFPSAPKIFNRGEKNELELNLQASHQQIENNYYEVELTAKANMIAKTEKKILMLIECKYGGLFEIANVSNNQLEMLLNIHAMEIVFPYLRETISNLSLRTSLQPILIPPTNFEKLYQQRKKENKTQ